jgi:hypothetical protein
MASGYGRYTGDPSAPRPKRKRTLADSLTNQSGLGGAFNSSSKPKKTDRYVAKPLNPTQGARHQSGVPKASMSRYDSANFGSQPKRRVKVRRKTGDGWIG